MRCLKAALEGASGSDGLVDRAAEVWRKASTDSDSEVSPVYSPCTVVPETNLPLQIRSIATLALTSFSSLVHPLLPPLQSNTTLARARAERLGGVVGDDLSIQDGADEFGPKEIEVDECPSSTMDIDSTPAPTPAPALEVAPAPLSFATASKKFGFAPPVKAFVTPKPVEVPAVIVETIPFISAPTGTKRKVEAWPVVASAGDGEEDDSDDEDEAMPSIVVESDEE